MKRETVVAVLQLAGTIRENLDAIRRIVDDEALPVGDRNLIDHAIATITSEVEVLSRTLADLLEDPTKTDAG